MYSRIPSVSVSVCVLICVCVCMCMCLCLNVDVEVDMNVEVDVDVEGDVGLYVTIAKRRIVFLLPFYIPFLSGFEFVRS